MPVFQLLLLFILASTSALATNKITLSEARKMFLQCGENKSITPSFFAALQASTWENKELHKAYLGAAETMMAETTFNVYKKYEYFSNGTKKIESSLSKFPDSIEIRFLRFTIQNAAPSLLFYNKNIAEDKQKILNFLNNTVSNDVELKQAILAYANYCKCLKQD